MADAKGGDPGRQHDAFERTTLATAIAGVIVLCIYTSLTYCQAIYTREAVKEATRAADEGASGNKINRLSQRAFVFINRIELTPYKQGDTVSWTLIPIWENSGNTPPVEGHMYVNWLPVPQPAGFSKCQIGSSVQPLISIAPHGTTNVASVSFPAIALNNFKNGQRPKLNIWGWFKYKDVIVGDTHITRFCWDITRVIGNPDDVSNPVSLLHSLCEEGNCFDDDCKESINGELKMPDIPGCHIDVTELPPVPAIPQPTAPPPPPNKGNNKTRR
jgi:hypothetical protein